MDEDSGPPTSAEGLSDEEVVALLNHYGPPVFRLLGTRLVAADREAGTVTMTFMATGAFCNPLGVVQGGILSAMLDDTAIIAGIVKTGWTQVFYSLEMKTSFLAQVRPGPLTGTGAVLKLGKTTAFLESRLFTPDGALVAHATMTARPAPVPDVPNLVPIRE